uniref:Uncharacterized protein n=1 Tax=Oryza barthii TaxID=65489 RepID=A0A0D3GI14_9ORYZ
MADGEEEEEAHDWRRSRAASPSARGSRSTFTVRGLAVLAFYLPARGSEMQLRSRCAEEASILEDLCPSKWVNP